MDFSKINNNDLVELYSSCIKELKSRKIIRTKNVLGELGEYIAIDFYNKSSGFLNFKLHQLVFKTLMQLVEIAKDILLNHVPPIQPELFLV